MILTIDFGTSVTKVGLWGEEGLVTIARAELATTYPDLGHAEQEPMGWWTSVVVGCAEVRAKVPDAFLEVDVVSCSAARQTFVPVGADAEPFGRGLLWSDRRAGIEARELAGLLGGEEAARQRTGVPLDSGAVAAKVAWLAAHEPDRLSASAWLLSPRDLVIWRLTGEVVTDHTLATRSGLYGGDGEVLPELAGMLGSRLPAIVASDHVVGPLRPVPAAELGLHGNIPVVIGAGDRQCEVLGTNASVSRPMVSWGTTANVSVPVDQRPDPIPPGVACSRGADGGWLIEGGLSAAGSFLAWWGSLLGTPPEALARLAAQSPPGARGVTVVPWLDGARAPWWEEDARAGFVGIRRAHGAADLTRALIESVAWDVVRCLEMVTAGAGSPPAGSHGLSLAGFGSAIPFWVDVLTGVTGLPAARRRSGEAASVGAALLGARAVGLDMSLDDLDPLEEEIEPDVEVVSLYRSLRAHADELAKILVSLPAASASPDTPSL